MAEKFLLKDVFHKGNIDDLAESIQSSWQRFDVHAFQTQVYSGFADLSFSERINRIAESLRDNLPEDFSKAVKIISESLGEEFQKKTSKAMRASFTWLYAPMFPWLEWIILRNPWLFKRS